jgi:hypothetical protein
MTSRCKPWGNLGLSLTAITVLLLQSDGAYGFQFPGTPDFLQRLPLPTCRIQQSLSSQVVDDVFAPTRVTNEGQPSSDLVNADQDKQAVPTTMQDAVRTFLFVGHYGPLCVVFSVLAFASWRMQLTSVDAVDFGVFGATVLFWSFQEHFLHEKVLHSKMDWVGKDIHQGHHDKPFYHISIDPAPLLLGWMLTAHLAFRTSLPLPLALTATVAYGMSGLFYEWAHYIVHTKVRFKSKFWKRVKENHLRHHVVSDEYWFAFSMPAMDDLFHTNPSVRQVKKRLEEEKRPGGLED